MGNHREKYTLESIPKMRRFSLDAGYLGRRRHIVHGLIEVDVTDAREAIRAHKQQTGESLSFTAFVIHCLGVALAGHPHLHAYRNWRNQLVIFEEIKVNTIIETEMGGRKIPMPYVFEGVDRKSVLDLHAEIRAAQTNPEQTEASKFMQWFLLLPAPLRRLFYWAVMRLPTQFRKYSSAVMVTAVGMFGRGGGWGITMPNFTLTVAIGGIVEKPGVVGGEIAIREFLDLTVSVDHDIVDGAPIVRFVEDFRTRLVSADGLPRSKV